MTAVTREVGHTKYSPDFAARLRGSKDAARVALVEGEPITVDVVALKPDGTPRPGPATPYTIRAMVGGYEITKFNPISGVVVDVHHLDMSFGPRPEHWECSCPSGVYNPAKAARERVAWRGCKHARMVVAVVEGYLGMKL